jgi:hypothetical protein
VMYLQYCNVNWEHGKNIAMWIKNSIVVYFVEYDLRETKITRIMYSNKI